MIETLSIRNLALVRELEIEFAPGFNVVSGETGAGKSLVLGALQILLGDRTPKSVIRRGEDRCDIAARVRLEPSSALRQSVDGILAEADLPLCEDGMLVLRRVITPSGNRVCVNSTACTLSVLARLGERLVDIHGPDNSRSLLRPGYQLDLLDSYAGLEEQRAECGEAHRAVAACREEREQVEGMALSEGERQLVEFQLRELEDADLREGEEDELRQQYDILSNSRVLIETASQCYGTLSEGTPCVSEMLAEVLRLAGQLEETDPRRTRDLRERLESIAAQVQDVAADLSGYAESVEVNGEELERVETRLDLVHRLSRKYGGSVQEALRHARELRERLESVTGRERRLRQLREQQEQADETYRDLCERLSQRRHAAAGLLADKIADTLERLGFLQSTFDIRVTPCDPNPAGTDAVEFCFSPNPGEQPLPLRKIASSGEIARTMLAVKTVLSAADAVPILVFDEVDANIGGTVAHAVATELASLGEHHQALCITHLPQIAAVAEQHFRVEKRVAGDRTETTVAPLDPPGREAELTRMLGGSDRSAARDHARELLNSRRQEALAAP